MELCNKKHQIRRKLFEGEKEIEKQIKENEIKIEELQKKMGIKVSPKTKKPENECKHKFKKMKPFHHNMMRFASPCRIFQHYYPIKRRHMKPIAVKFGNTEYIDIPKETETTTESNEVDMKMKTIDDWEKCLLNKTQEITNKLAEKFKGFKIPNLNISWNAEENKKEDKKEEKKEEKKDEVKEKKLRAAVVAPKTIHKRIQCDGCGAFPIIGNRYKCAICPHLDYCEECEERNKDSHLHPFIKIYSPECANFDIKCSLK
jgi:hypothetical protein